jgi:hypothetical protein
VLASNYGARDKRQGKRWTTAYEDRYWYLRYGEVVELLDLEKAVLASNYSSDALSGKQIDQPGQAAGKLPIYWINMDASKDRREKMEIMFSSIGHRERLDTMRSQAVDKDIVRGLIDTGRLVTPGNR